MFWLRKMIWKLLVSMTSQDYWLRLVTGVFWSWKTKNLFQEAFFRKKDNPDWLLIANIPYSFVDIHFNSKTDLNLILSHVLAYIEATNNIEDMQEAIFPPIKILIDEVHCYYFARDFKAFDKDVMTIITQCRKRRITIDFISQELAQLDVFIRRLTPLVLCYEKSFLGFKRAVLYYARANEWTDLWSETQFEEMDKTWIFPDKRVLFFNPDLKKYYDEKYLTYYVVWFTDILQWFTFEQFKQKQLELYEKYGYLPLKKHLDDYQPSSTSFFPQTNMNYQKDLTEDSQDTLVD